MKKIAAISAEIVLFGCDKRININEIQLFRLISPKCVSQQTLYKLNRYQLKEAQSANTVAYCVCSLPPIMSMLFTFID